MFLNWFCLLLLVNFHFSENLAMPAQKFSPGIPITPTENQIPGKVSGVIEKSTSGPINAAAPSDTQPAAPPTVIRTQSYPTSVKVQPVHHQQTIYLESNPTYYSSPQYVGQNPTAYVYPDGSYAPAPPQLVQTGTRFNGNYYRPPAGALLGSGSPSNLLSGLLGGTSRWSSAPPSTGQALGALGALGTAGILGAGALGAGALLLG